MIEQIIAKELVERGIKQLGNLANTTLDVLMQKMGNFIEEIKTGIPKKELTLIDLAEIYSSPLDLVMQKAQNEGYRCVGGEFIIHYMDDKNFKISYDLYMQNSENKWVKRSSCSKKQSNLCLTDDSCKELKEKGKVVYEIYPPEINNF